MKTYNLLFCTLLLVGCSGRPASSVANESTVEASDSVRVLRECTEQAKAYFEKNSSLQADCPTQLFYQFYGWMLFEQGERDMAVASLFRSAENGHAEAQHLLGCCYAKRPDLINRPHADIDSAILWWTRAAKQNYWEAQCELADYYTQRGDVQRARYWRKQAKKNK